MDRDLLKRIQEVLIVLSGAMSGADADRMVEAMTVLDGLATENRGALPPRLQHFLDQRSYAKAMAWLEEILGTGSSARPAG